VAEACVASREGQGFHSYLEALERFARGDLTGELTESDEEELDEEELDEEESEDEEVEEPSGPVKTLGRGRRVTSPEKSLAVSRSPGGATKTLGRKVEAPAEPASPQKTLGRKAKGTRGPPAEDFLSRALVRQKIADRLAGRLTPSELATWARAKWSDVQRGAPAESDYRDLLEDCLQRLTLSTLPVSKLSDPELVDMMTRLEG
jgi:3-dehydroquinate dehydratase-2